MRADRKRYEGTVSIPEGESGKIKVRHLVHAAGHVHDLATARTRIMGGDNGGSVSWSRPTVWHELSEEGRGVWMTDLPIEQKQHYDALASFRSGSVLIGGLGLGVAAGILTKREQIRRIVVVEKSADVCKLVGPHAGRRGFLLPKNLTIVNADLFDYLAAGEERFDRAFYDIWQSDGEGTFFKTVVPLLKLSGPIVKRRPVCWNENVMRGQLWMGLTSRIEFLFMPDELKKGYNTPSLEESASVQDSIWHDWMVPFWKWVLEKKPDRSRIEEEAKNYVAFYGTSLFDKWWPILSGQKASGIL
jgi:hypothetical protein